MAEEKSNVVLIGMPGAGKSTLGIVLAKIMALKFVDADLVIQEQMDKTLQTIIDAMGPDGFIQIENEILSDLEAEETVIATGGSAIYSDEAMKHLSDIGVIVYLEISYDSLKGEDITVTMVADDLNITAAARKVACALDHCEALAY